MKKDFDCSPNNNNYKTDFENLIKLAIVHNYAIHASLPTLDKDYPNYIHKWKKSILLREDIVFNKDKPFIVQTSEAKQDEDVLTMVIGNTMHVLDFMMAYFFTHKKGGVYTALGEIGPYDDMIYAELLTRGYIEDYNIGNFYDSNQEKTNDLIRHFCSLDSKKKKIYIMLNEEDYKYINEYLNTISTCSSSPTTVYVQKNFNYEMKNNEVRIIDFNIEETLVKASFKISNGKQIYTSEYCNLDEYEVIKEDGSEHIYYYNPSWGAQYLIYKFGNKKVISKATLLSKVASWEKIFLDNLI